MVDGPFKVALNSIVANADFNEPVVYTREFDSSTRNINAAQDLIDNVRELQSELNILDADTHFLVSADDITFTPTIGDMITANSIDYMYVSHETTKDAGVPVGYDIQMKKVDA